MCTFGLVGWRGPLVGVEKGSIAVPVCSACEKALPASAFNKTQLSKGEGKQRCRECVTSAEQAEASGAAAPVPADLLIVDSLIAVVSVALVAVVAHKYLAA